MMLKPTLSHIFLISFMPNLLMCSPAIVSLFLTMISAISKRAYGFGMLMIILFLLTLVASLKRAIGHSTCSSTSSKHTVSKLSSLNGT